MNQDIKIAVGVIAVTGLLAILFKSKSEPRKVIL